MMKIITICLACLLVSCKSKQDTTEINKTVPFKETVMLWGQINQEGLTKEPFSKWFLPNKENYRVDNALLDSIHPKIAEVEIKVFLGTWCSDSQREVPHFYKILEQLNFDENRLKVYAVDREKATEKRYENDLNINRVPTFIFYKHGNEINRIVEFPLTSLERDMLDILSGLDYKDAYAEW